MACQRRGALPVTLLLISLVGLSGCGQHTGADSSATETTHITPSPLVTPLIPTPVVPPASPLTWDSRQLPSGSVTALGVAQSDSATAYVCVPTTSNALTIAIATWVTHDRGVNWQRMSDFTIDATKIRVDGLAVNVPITVSGCQILVDPAQANTAIAQPVFAPTHGCAPAIECYGYARYATTDDGSQWTFLQSPLFVLSQGHQVPLDHLITFASQQGVTYALFETTPRSESNGTQVAMTSRDGLRTWTPIPSLQGVTFAGFWVNPSNRNLLVAVPGWGFRTSTDGGVHWTMTTESPFPFHDVAVQQPFTDQSWRICGGDPSATTATGQPNPNIDILTCSSDGGIHWTAHHLSVPNDLGGEAHYTLVGIADDGAALLATPRGLERVVDGVDSMQPLGSLPTSDVLLYAAGGGSGTLWSVSQSDFPSSNLQGPIFTARYV